MPSATAVTHDSPGRALPIAREILRYFLRNPAAADSLEGIARWRVREERIHRTVEQVDQALGWLVKNHYLLRERTVGIEPLFRLNRERIADAQRLVEGDPLVGDGGVARADPSRAADALKVVSRWIDVRLYRYCSRHPPGDQDMPGLSLSHASLMKLLAPASAGAEPDAQSGEARREKERSELLRALEDTSAANPFSVLYRRLRLTELELEALLLSLAPEMDVKYHRVYGVLNDDMGRREVTLGLLCSLLGEPSAVRTELERSGALIRWLLLDRGQTLPRADEPVRVDPVIVAWLLGRDAAVCADPHLAHVVRHGGRCKGRLEGERSGTRPDAVTARLTHLLRTGDAKGTWIVLSGEAPAGWAPVVEAAAREVQESVLHVWPSHVVGENGDPQQLSVRVSRAARLLGAIPVVYAVESGGHVGDAGALADLVNDLSAEDRPSVVVTPDTASVIGVLPPERVLVLHRQSVDAELSADAFFTAAAEVGLPVTVEEAGRLALSFCLPTEKVAQAARLAALEERSRERPGGAYALLARACRQLACPELPRFARRVEPIFRLSDVVLPLERHRQLREIVSHVRCAAKVLHSWGFGQQLPYGRGVAALFCGPSGTGKTMAAQAIADALETETYVVDLSRVVSKYIGETEKNLDVVFADAERGGAVLLFDEADALFGKRSQIKDAHDRYANIEVAYLLQRMEEFGGLVILATNLRRNMDEAFLRRLRFVVEFPMPDPEAREAIWRQCLPLEAPRGDDVEGGLAFLARELELTGGNIRQITLRAAFAAAEENDVITMRQLLGATRAELRRLGMMSAEHELAEYEAATRQARGRVA